MKKSELVQLIKEVISEDAMDDLRAKSSILPETELALESILYTFYTEILRGFVEPSRGPTSADKIKRIRQFISALN